MFAFSTVPLFLYCDASFSEIWQGLNNKRFQGPNPHQPSIELFVCVGLCRASSDFGEQSEMMTTMATITIGEVVSSTAAETVTTPLISDSSASMSYFGSFLVVIGVIGAAANLFVMYALLATKHPSKENMMYLLFVNQMSANCYSSCCWWSHFWHKFSTFHTADRSATGFVCSSYRMRWWHSVWIRRSWIWDPSSLRDTLWWFIRCGTRSTFVRRWFMQS